MIPLSVPDIDQNDVSGVTEVLQSGMLVQHKNVIAFENEMKKWLTPEHRAVAVSNGTAALHLALLALDVGAGDHVLVPTYSWPATANAVEICGATPLFVDIEERTWGMDPQECERVLTEAQKKNLSVKAVLIVHAFGCPAKMDELLTVCKKFDLPLIEDAACAIGSHWQGAHAGTLGMLGCFSFHPRKVVTTGEGGMISTTDQKIDRQLRALRNHGQDPEATSPDFICPGFNYRMTDMQGALGLSQLKKLPGMLEKRNRLAKIYQQELSQKTPFGFQRPYEKTGTNWQTFVVTLPQEILRGNLVEKLGTKGISAMMGTWHIPLIRYYKTKYGYQTGDFPVTDKIFTQSMSLPLHHKMSEEDVLMIVENIKAIL